MAMSRSDFGMLAILVTVGVGFFAFSARDDERKAKAEAQGKSKNSVPKNQPTAEVESEKNQVTPTTTSDRETSDKSTDTLTMKNMDDKDSEDSAYSEIPAMPSMFPGDFSTADVTPSNINKEELTTLIARYSKCPEGKLLVVGHTDDYGGNDRNQFISHERAKVVKNILVDEGVVSEKISTLGAGAKNPTAPNASNKGRHFNRRVDISCAL